MRLLVKQGRKRQFSAATAAASLVCLIVRVQFSYWIWLFAESQGR